MRDAITETFYGGWTWDNLLQAFERLDGAKPLTLLLNHVTATAIYRDLADASRHGDGCPFCEIGIAEHHDVLQALEKHLLPSREDGDPPTKIYATIHREKVPDQQLRVFASDGRLHIWNFP